MATTRLNHAGCADLRPDSRHPVWRSHEIPQLAKRGHLVHDAVGEYHRRKLGRFASDQAELDPPEEELAGGHAVRRQTLATRNAKLSFLNTIARFCSSVRRRRFDSPSVLCSVKRYLQRAISSAA
jgi:hypothetical protein